MHIISKVFLFILSSLCLFFLVFFTFITPSYDKDLSYDYSYYQTGIYEVVGQYPDYKITEKGSEIIGNNLKFYNLSIGNNIYYYQGEIEDKGNNEIHLGKGIYYIDINSLHNLPILIIDGAKIKTYGPGGIVINTTHKIQKSVLSISAKVEVELNQQDNGASTYLDIYPNMYIMYNPVLNKQIVNADLLRIQNVQYLNMINSQLYGTSIDSNNQSNFILDKDIQKYIFYNNENDYLFIKNIQVFKKYLQTNYKKNYNKISQKNFYHFPGEQYIINYYSYFLNDEKRKAYYKNIILKELINGIQKGSELNVQNITLTLNKLQSIDIGEYDNIMNIIYYYYENILNSQLSSPDTIIKISSLLEQINKSQYYFKFPSLLNLRNIYENYHNENYLNYHKYLNIFIDLHVSEMDISIYDEKHRIHSYFLFFLKNILISDFTRVENHTDVINLFKKYLDIKELYIEKGDNNTKKTALYDNAQLLKVFTNITKINFFTEERDEQGLLQLIETPLLTNKDYQILNENLNKILDFYDKYQFFINNSQNRKDYILSLSYKKYSKSLNEYFEALTDYNQYQLANNKAVTQPLFEVDDKNKLEKNKAVEYLSQFIGISSYDTDIQIKNYAHCTQPEIELIDNINDDNGYCYQISNLDIEGYIFNFILTPTENNTISYLSYTDINGNIQKNSRNFIMDNIEQDLENKYNSAFKEDKELYNFKRFFLNNFIYTDTKLVNKDDDITQSTLDFTPPVISDESISIRKLKLALLNNNSPLSKIRSIIPISYNYLIIKNNNNSYEASIFATDFQLSIKENNSSNMFKGKFASNYQYEGEHTFSDVSIYIENQKSYDGVNYLLNETPILINETFLIKNIEEVLTNTLYNFDKIEHIYNTLSNKYTESEIKIIYNIKEDKVIFTTGTIKVELFHKGDTTLYDNNVIINQGRFSNLSNYLNTLP